MPPNGRSANQRRIWSARYPTTTTNLVIPASRHEVMTCSRSGMPRRRTRGLGTPPETDAIRLPLPAARIRHSLTVVMAGAPWRTGVFRKAAPLRTKARALCDSWLQHLRCGHYGVVRSMRRLGGVIEILDVYVRCAKNMGFSDALRGVGKPE